MSGSRRTALAAPLSPRGARAARTFGYLIASARGILAWPLRCAERAAERRALAQLTDWQLQDIGISRAEADAETDKRWWRG